VLATGGARLVPHIPGDGQLLRGFDEVRFAVAPRGGRAKRRLKAFVIDFLKKPSSGSPEEQDEALKAAICAHKAGRQLHLTGMEMADREAARVHTIENRLSERTKEQALEAHFAERTMRTGEGGSHPSRSARLERKHRAHRLPPCTHHIQVMLRHRHLAESAADITAGALRSDKLLRTWLVYINRLDRAHLAIVLRELDEARIVQLRDLLKGFLPVDGHGGDYVFIAAERALTILASFAADAQAAVAGQTPMTPIAAVVLEEADVATAQFTLAAQRLDSMSGAMGLVPFRSVPADVLLTSFLNVPTATLDHLLSELLGLRLEYTLDAVQRALAPLENIEGVLLAVLFSRLLEPSIRDFVEENIGNFCFQGPGELFSYLYYCCEYQDASALDVWWRELCAYRVSDQVRGSSSHGAGAAVYERVHVSRPHVPSAISESDGAEQGSRGW